VGDGKVRVMEWGNTIEVLVCMYEKVTMRSIKSAIKLPRGRVGRTGKRKSNREF
jgi:hypothetical protein